MSSNGFYELDTKFFLFVWSWLENIENASSSCTCSFHEFKMYWLVFCYVLILQKHKLFSWNLERKPGNRIIDDIFCTQSKNEIYQFFILVYFGGCAWFCFSVCHSNSVVYRQTLSKTCQKWNQCFYSWSLEKLHTHWKLQMPSFFSFVDQRDWLSIRWVFYNALFIKKKM